MRSFVELFTSHAGLIDAHSDYSISYSLLHLHLLTKFS